MLEGVSPDHMTSVYSCFDVLVSPYVNVLGESFAIANVEAMAMGIPVIHFNIGGMRVCVCLRLVALRCSRGLVLFAHAGLLSSPRELLRCE